MDITSKSSSSPALNEQYLLNSSEPMRANDTIVIPLLERPETFLAPIIFFFIFTIGVYGNGTLVWIFIKHRAIWNGPNTYILSLALADLLIILTCVPFTSTVYTFESWPYGLTICKISEFSKDVSIGVSVFTLTALSADRFFAIVDPLKKLHASIGSRHATKLTLLIVFLIWICSIIFATPAAVFSHIRSFPNDTAILFNVCYPYPQLNWPSNYPRFMIFNKFMIYYLLPLLIISVFYVLMAMHLIRSTKNLPGEAQGQQRQIKARRKVAVTVLAFVTIFAICFLPQHVFLLWFYFNPNSEKEYDGFWHSLRLIGYFLSFSNSCINPIALYFVSGTFRQYFDDYLQFCRRNQASRHRCRTINNSNNRGVIRRDVGAETAVVYAAVTENVTIRTTPPYFGLTEVSTEYIHNIHNGFAKNLNKDDETVWESTSAVDIPMTSLNGKKENTENIDNAENAENNDNTENAENTVAVTYSGDEIDNKLV